MFYTPLNTQIQICTKLFFGPMSLADEVPSLQCCSWALVKDEEMAKRMTKFIELSTIGVSKDSQLRAAKILQAVSDSCEHAGDSSNFFEISYHHIAHRWKQLRKAVEESGIFSTPEFPPAFCKYSSRMFSTQPGKFYLFLAVKT